MAKDPIYICNSGTALPFLRRGLGLTQRALARRLGISIPDLSRIERGEAPIPEHLRERLAEVLSMPMP